MTDTVDLLQNLANIGVIQFGQFPVVEKPGQLAPMAFNLGLLASYPPILRSLATEIAPLTAYEGLTHLLVMPNLIPLGTAVSLINSMPLVYPSCEENVEGAYDFSVPTVLLTGILSNGFAERALIKRVKSLGLDVHAVAALFSFEEGQKPVGELPLKSWRRVSEIPSAIPGLPPLMRETIDHWLAQK